MEELSFMVSLAMTPPVASVSGGIAYVLDMAHTFANQGMVEPSVNSPTLMRSPPSIPH